MPTPATSSSPPKPHAALRIGVVGHRHDASRFPPSMAATLEARIAELLQALGHAAESVRQADANCFSPARAKLIVVSALAEGADRCGARVALQRGLELQAILPFERAEYAKDFEAPDSADEFATILAQASRVLELPGSRDSADAAYALAGLVAIRNVDVLIALWDGGPAAGPGGTADTVGRALALGVPVVHLDIFDREPAKIRWLGWPEPSSHEQVAPAPERIFQGNATPMITALMRPPSSRSHASAHIPELPEGRALTDYLGERMWRWRWRPEHAIFQFLFGGRAMRWTDIRAGDYLADSKDGWTLGGADGKGSMHATEAMQTVLWPRFAFADNLAEHYGQNYRSGYISNFALAACAVIFSIVGFVFPSVTTALAFAELVFLLLIVCNTSIGNHRRWHRRWLDYRHLAERLRNLHFSAMLGDLDLIPEPTNIATPSWVAWYVRASARETGIPGVVFDAQKVFGFGREFSSAQLDPQIDYHERNTHRLHTAEHRLHLGGMTFFSLSIVVCSLHLLHAGVEAVLKHPWGTFVHPFSALVHHWGEWIHQYGVLLTISLPAVATAMYGIKTQGEFRARAERSRRTCAELTTIKESLEAPGYTFHYLQHQVDRAGSVMLDDLADWRITYGRRRLENPA
ncbi:hypothetical protein SRS16CHR_03772 [Variovorax sp. SRS16]|uniref:hypothetical protein n=1 Tax=Variovorax sp. SRS16 TaxID=282217 RepID=UPI001317B721|nr:hypothetical protein [Variovorax sp. SRS16]VTU26007.1 hypothetical protein SRS16CHR_03772 [Variovorax sp. SRS16]